MNPEAFLEHWTRLSGRSYFVDFDPSAVPVMVFDGSSTYLFGAPTAPAGFQARGAWFEHAGRFDAVTANTATDGTALVMHDDPEEAAVIAVHEAFHVFQGQRFPHWGANEMLALTYPVTDAEALALRRLETIALHRALENLDQGWALEMLRIRAQRFAIIGAAAARFEQDLERHEGLALYVELQAREVHHRLPLEDFPAEAVRFRAYATGQALGRLLETWRPDWQRAVRDASLDDLLRATLTATDAPARTLAPVVVQRETRRASFAVADIHASRTRDRDEFHSSAAPLLVVHSDKPLHPQGFDPMNLRVLMVSELLHKRFLRLGNTAGHVQTLGVAAITHGDPFAGTLHHLEIALNAEPDVLHGDGVLELRGEGLELRFAGGSLEREPKRWTVRLG